MCRRHFLSYIIQIEQNSSFWFMTCYPPLSANFELEHIQIIWQHWILRHVNSVFLPIVVLKKGVRSSKMWLFSKMMNLKLETLCFKINENRLNYLNFLENTPYFSRLYQQGWVFFYLLNDVFLGDTAFNSSTIMTARQSVDNKSHLSSWLNYKFKR